ncbi:MAG: phytoene desaturase family protein [Woeseiaceae bacterium]|nr:phytoene desaturase family protein [Woeseiaceae bacterium]
MSNEPHVIVIGAGVGGLSTAIDLAAGGARVTLFESASVPGGRMREIVVDGQGIDSGPTVFTMRWVFDELFAAAGHDLGEEVDLVKADVLARHSWIDGSRLDLYADVERTVDAIGEFAGAAEASAYRRFAAESKRIFETLDHSFMRAEKPSPLGLTLSIGLLRVSRLWATKPFTTMWKELGRMFADPRLRQLFARYATYCGSSPFQSPATLMLIAHAERAGVWYVEGGMQRFAEALARVAEASGAELRYNASVERLLVRERRVCGVVLDGGEEVNADAVVFNGDVAALTDGLLGEAAEKSVRKRNRESRSLSAITWSLKGRVEGFPLEHHTVFFGDNYIDEFGRIFDRSSVCERPTIYICAQDRGGGRQPDFASERLFLLVNAPPRTLTDDEVAAIEENAFQHLEMHGVRIEADGEMATTSPGYFAGRFPGSGGAIYGWPTHGFSGSFKRSGSRSRLKGLYLAGGSVHPGPGVPMTALSGRIAAKSVRADLGLA